MKAYTRDITQAYVQSDSNLERTIYLKPPQEVNIATVEVLKAVEPLCSIAESGRHCYLTYIDDDLRGLGIERPPVDPFLLCKRAKSGLRGLLILQLDDSLGI